jgi:NAD(P)-dependent dehydrogenase (short-subunit alcohol dehydrogenase family)
MSNPYLIQVDKAALQHVANKTAVVTGGCSGIGLATVKLMASLGCNVLVGDLQDQPADEDGLFAHENVRYRQCDISKWESLASFFATASTCFGGPIDIVAANAGINEYGDQLSRTRRDAAGKWLEPDYRTLDVDLKGAINTVALALNHFDTTRGGSIILTASLAGYQGTGNMPIYSAAKHGWSSSYMYSRPRQVSLT